jgi:hypothetical protein
MIPITDDFSVGNGFEVMYISGLSPKTLRFSTTGTIAMAISKVQPLLSSLRRPALDPFWLLPNSRCQKSPISLMGLSRSFASFAVIVNWISGENILNYLRARFTRMFELKSLPTYTRFRSFMGRIGWRLSLTPFLLGSTPIPNLGNRCLDIKTLRYRVTDVLIFRT